MHVKCMLAILLFGKKTYIHKKKMKMHVIFHHILFQSILYTTEIQKLSTQAQA